MVFLSGTGWSGDDSDYVVIQMPGPIGKPLKIGAPANHVDALFRLGFASCTGCASSPNKTDPELNIDRKENGNSDGQSLNWTSGPAYALDAAAELLGAPKSFFENTHKSNWVFFEADAQVEISGGPLLNSLGVRSPEFNKQ